MYILLCGYPPFTGKTAEEIMSRIKKGKYEFPGIFKNIYHEIYFSILIMIKT